jgi:hypothetical protein
LAEVLVQVLVEQFQPSRLLEAQVVLDQILEA